MAAFRGLGRWLALVAALLALCIASVFAGRRFFDSWERELGGLELLLLTFVFLGALTGFRRLWANNRITSHGAPGDAALHAVPSLAAILLAAAVSSHHSPLWGVIFLWAALAAVETWFWKGFAPALLHRRAEPAPAQLVTRERRQPEVREEEGPPEDDVPSNRLQHLTRSREEDGAEVVQGILRAELQPGQRVHHLHVAFCPPLDAVPEFASEQIEGPEATLTAGQVETYGARIDLRLAAPAAQGESILVEFYARCGA